MVENKRHILHLVEYFYPHAVGGSEWSTYYLLKGILAAGHEVTLLTPNYGTVVEERWEGIHIIRSLFLYRLFKKRVSTFSPIWHNNPLSWLVCFLYMCKLHLKQKVDVVHVHSKSYLVPAVLFKFIFHIPLVVTLRDYYSLCPFGLCLTTEREYKHCTGLFLFTHEVPKYIKQYSDASFFKWLFHYTSAGYAYIIRTILYACLSQADKVICISKKVQKIYAANGIKKTKVIYNSMDFKKELPKNQYSQNILYVGRLTPGKGVIPFILAIKEILKSNSKVKAQLFGKGLLKQRIIPTLSKIEQKRILFRGHMNYNETLGAIKHALLVVVPSVWEEPFGRVALEALSKGTPVVVSTRGGLPEIVKNGVTGYISEPKKESLIEAIKKGIQNNARLRQGIRREYKQLSYKFSVQPIRQYIQIYNQF